ncbi:C39 family peptidase [Candidatus Dependentiae bacterium]|nr:C39 family peptidase [Candidatus Dependentiae bacterium]
MKLKNIVFSIILFFSGVLRAVEWTWLYSINPNTELSENIFATNTEGSWVKAGVPRFSQLIFSWNSLRPAKGHYSFWVRVRDSVTKKWYKWHQMAQWGTDQKGRNLQRSFYSKTVYGTNYSFVRLDLPKGRLADGFSIKIKAHNNASIKYIKNITVNICNLRLFSSEAFAAQPKLLQSVYIKGVPRKSQMALKHPRCEVLCSPTSTTMLINHLLKKNLDARHVANGVYDSGLGVYGSWAFNTAHAFEVSNNKVLFHVQRLDSFKTLHSYLARGIPVVVSVRGPLKGAASPYASGHLLLVVGYNKRFKKVLCQDPAFKKDSATAVAYNLKDFLLSWERSNRLAYVARYA